MKFSINDFFSKCDQIRKKNLLKKSLMENFIFCAMLTHASNTKNSLKSEGVDAERYPT